MQERDFSRALLQGDACTVIIAYNLAFNKVEGTNCDDGMGCEENGSESYISIDLWIYEIP